MSILKVDDKWSVVYDPKSNDSPKMWMRHGDRHYPFDESNAVVAMFYALKEAREALTQSRADAPATRTVTVAQLDRWLGCLVSLEIKDEIHTIIGDVK